MFQSWVLGVGELRGLRLTCLGCEDNVQGSRQNAAGGASPRSWFSRVSCVVKAVYTCGYPAFFTPVEVIIDLVKQERRTPFAESSPRHYFREQPQGPQSPMIVARCPK